MTNMSKRLFQEVEFIGSYDRVEDCPSQEMPCYAFVGRSNVGKSSLINLLTDRKKLARISKQPGKTQMINFFNIDNSWYLVDLPGYGYAKESKKMRAKWNKMVRSFLLEAPNLMTSFVLVDSNVPPQEHDLSFMSWLGEHDISFGLIYTKVDRHRKEHIRTNKIEAIQQAILKSWSDLPPQFAVSAVSGEGREQLLDYITQLNSLVKDHKD